MRYLMLVGVALLGCTQDELQVPECWQAVRIIDGSSSLDAPDADVNSPFLVASDDDSVRIFFTRNLETPSGYAVMPHQATNASGRWEVAVPDILDHEVWVDAAVGDASGNAHAIASTDPEYLRIDAAGGILRETIPLEAGVSHRVGVGVDDAGRVHALFYGQFADPLVTALIHAIRSEDGVWDYSTTDVPNDPYAGFAVEPSGAVHITMTPHDEEGGLFHSRSTEGEAAIPEEVDGDRSQESAISVAGGSPSIVFSRETGELEEALFWAVLDGEAWRVEAVSDVQPWRYEGLQLTVDADGRVIIVSQGVPGGRDYEGSEVSNIFLFVRDERGWHTQVVATNEVAEWSTASAAVTANGAVHVAFAARASVRSRDESSGALYYARREPFSSCPID